MTKKLKEILNAHITWLYLLENDTKNRPLFLAEISAASLRFQRKRLEDALTQEPQA